VDVALNLWAKVDAVRLAQLGTALPIYFHVRDGSELL
jgi:hypothetical protein